MIRTCGLWLLYAGMCIQGAEFTTYIGGARQLQLARAVADAAGNTYLAGTQSNGVVVAKLDAAGHTTFFRGISGEGPASVSDLAVDANGNVYVGGATASSDFPLHNAMQSTPGPGFVAKLSADGSQLVWSTYFREAVTALAVDMAGNVYVTGSTSDATFPVTAGLPNGTVTRAGPGQVAGAFFAKIAAAGDRIVYSMVISGQAKDCGCCSSCFLSERNTVGVSVAVDSSGNAYLAGNTDTHDLPATAGALLQVGTGAFVAKVMADGSALSYLTFIGSTAYPISPATNPANTAVAIACDPAGNAYLTGTTSDPKFPATAGALQTNYDGPTSNQISAPPADAFVLKLKADGSSVIWGTYLGGAGREAVNSIALDPTGQVWITGTTASADFPNAQGWSKGKDFVSGLDALGTKLVYSARYPDDGASRSVSADGNGMLHIAGPGGIVSAVLPGGVPLPRIFGVANAANGPLDGRVAPGEVIAIYGPHIGPAIPVITTPDSDGNLPTSIPGYQVISTLPYGAPLPLLYASDSQINAVIPFGSYLDGPIHINTPNGTTPDFIVSTVPARPEIFRNADNSAIAINQDGTPNSVSNPASFGSYVAVWVTGSGLPLSGNAGQIAAAAHNYYCCAIEAGLTMLPVIYGGNAPGAALGVTQVNFQIPVGAPLSGPVGIRLLAREGSLSLPVTIFTH